MGRIRQLYEGIRDRVFGRAPEETPAPPIAKKPRIRLDQGPAEAWYVKRCFPKGIFRKKLTHCREMQIRNSMRFLREDQKAIARAKGWTRGLDV